MKHIVRACLSVALIAIFVAPAHAAITTTAVTTPSTDTYRTVTRVNGSAAASITFSGTSDASAPTDQVDLKCYHYNSSGIQFQTIQNSVDTNDATGAWTWTGDPSSLDGGSCTARAIPSGSVPMSFATYSGRRIVQTEVSTTTITAGPNAGMLTSYGVENAQRDAYNDWYSFGDCALCDSSVQSTSGSVPYMGPYLWYFNDSPYSGVGYPLGDTSYGIVIDDDTAFDAYRADYITINAVPNAGRAFAGFPALTVAHTMDPTTRDFTTVERQSFVRCNADTDTVTPGATCTSFVPTGVKVKRTYKFSHHGLRVQITDVYASTDGAAHAVKMQMYEAQEGAVGATDPVFLMPWISNVFQLLTNAQVLTKPSTSVWSYQVRASTAAVSIDRPIGAVVVDRKPTTLMVQPSDHDDIVHLQTFTVPATGSYRVRQAYVMDSNAADVETGQEHFIDLFTLPQITKVKPRNGARVRGASVVVRGRATDQGTIERVTVNGHRTTLKANGKFRYTVNLSMGINRIRIRATDGAGNRTTKLIRIKRIA